MKQLPPINSRRIEFDGTSFESVPKKLSKNFIMRLASVYSGSERSILNSSGSTYCFITHISYTKEELNSMSASS